MNAIFMGTPDFAVASLDYMAREGHNVLCAVTQPDKPRGRGNKVSFSPVKEKAVELNIPVMQPVKIKNDSEFIDKLKCLNPDIIVVVAFGQILPKEVLSIPKYGCINVHASLLPRLRGAAPINWAIINGDKEAGVTTMFMDTGLDTGDMLLMKKTEIGVDETAGELHDRLSIMGAELLIKTLRQFENGAINRTPQDSSKSTYAPMLDRDTGRIDWHKSSEDIKNLVRGTNPWPVSYSFLNGEKLKIWRADMDEAIAQTGKPGQVYKVDKNGIYIYSKDGGIILKEVQAENSKRVDAYAYTLGHPVKIDSVFGK